jgi:flagellar protein FlbB
MVKAWYRYEKDGGKTVTRVGMGPRIVGYFFLLLALVMGGLYWFDFLGLINASAFFNPITSLWGQWQHSADADNPVLLEELRVRKMEEALDMRFQEYLNLTMDLEKRDQGVLQKAAEVEEREKALNDRENSFNQVLQQYDDKVTNLVQNSKWLTSMRPEMAIEILKNYSDQDLIDVLRVTEELAVAEGTRSLVSVWLAGIPQARAAEIQRKMILKPLN